MHRIIPRRHIFAVFLAFALLTGCASPRVTGEDITIRISADDADRNTTVPSGTTVKQALQLAGIAMNESDQVEPPPYTVLNYGDSIQVIRVVEKFETEEQIIPFERQVVRNESL